MNKDMQNNKEEKEEPRDRQENQIEIANAIEEISELVSQCNYCGLCKESEPVWRVLRGEAISPRGRAILFSKSIFDKSVFDSCLSGHCMKICPLSIDIDSAIRKARKIMNLRGHEHPANKQILGKIVNKQNPFME